MKRREEKRKEAKRILWVIKKNCNSGQIQVAIQCFTEEKGMSF